MSVRYERTHDEHDTALTPIGMSFWFFEIFLMSGARADMNLPRAFASGVTEMAISHVRLGLKGVLR